MHGLAADSLHDFAEQNEIHIRVDELRPDRIQQLQFADSLDRFRGALVVVADGVVGEQAAVMDQQIVNRDRLLVVRGEFRQERRDLVAQPQLASFDQQHDAGRGRHRFGDRGHVEHRVGRHRQLAGLELFLPKRLEERDLSMPPDAHDAAGHLLLSESLGDDRVDP